MVLGDGVRNDIRNNLIVGLRRRSDGLLRARGRVIDPFPGAIETSLKPLARGSLTPTAVLWG